MLAIIDDGRPMPPTVYRAIVPVRWGDQDADGHVNNAVVLRYVEEARIQWAQHLALHSEAPHSISVVANLACEYLSPIRYPQTLAISIACAHVGNSSVQLLFDVHGAAIEPYARVRVTWVSVHAQSRRPHAMPDALRRACTPSASDSP